jgi:hypothetical protein
VRGTLAFAGASPTQVFANLGNNARLDPEGRPFATLDAQSMALLDALHAGLQVTLLSDAVGGRRPDDATACLAALRHAGAHVLPSESVFYALLRDVRHPFFKTYTQLVKSHG